MKKIGFYGLVVMLLFSLVQFNISNACAGEIDYKKIFEYECQKCHERYGNGTKRGKKLGVPDFTDAEWQTSVTDEHLIASITIGKKKMPAQKHKLSQEEIKALVRYVRILAPKKRR